MSDRIHEIWPQWETVEKIGSGSYGEVFKVKRDLLGTSTYAAVKYIRVPQQESEVRDLLNSGMDHDSVCAYFEDMVKKLMTEIMIMESLKSSAHIVKIEDFHVEEHKEEICWEFFIRMEYLTDLSVYMSENTLTEEEIVRLGLQITEALCDCEQVHIIHRDIKVNNIFITQFNAFKLGDFGISKQLEKTQSAVSQKGTNMYMAPEVFRGEHYDKRVDIYSLGIMLYRILNKGRFPFLPPVPQQITYGDTQRAMEQRLGGVPVPPVPGVPAALSDIIVKACAFQPDDRYSSAKEMYDDLMAYQMSVGNQAQTVSSHAGDRSGQPNVYSRGFAPQGGSAPGQEGYAATYSGRRPEYMPDMESTEALFPIREPAYAPQPENRPEGMYSSERPVYAPQPENRPEGMYSSERPVYTPQPGSRPEGMYSSERPVYTPQPGSRPEGMYSSERPVYTPQPGSRPEGMYSSERPVYAPQPGSIYQGKNPATMVPNALKRTRRDEEIYGIRFQEDEELMENFVHHIKEAKEIQDERMKKMSIGDALEKLRSMGGRTQ